MASPTQSLTLDTVFVAHGREYLKRQPTDNYYKANPTLALMRKKAKALSGGKYFIEPILSGGEPVGGAYARGQSLSTTPTDPVTEAVYEVAFYGEPVTIYYQDEMKAGGAGALFDYVETRIDDAQMKLERQLALDLWRSTQLTNGIIPIPVAISTSTTLGGIAPGTYTWWVAQNEDTVTFSSAGPDKMRNIANDVSFGGSKQFSRAITDQATWEAYVDLVEGAHQINSVSTASGAGRVGDLGFQTCKYQGKDLLWDRNINLTQNGVTTTGRSMWFLNDDGIYLGEMAGGAWRLSEFAPMHVNGQQGRIAYVRWCGQLIVRHRQCLGSITTIS